MKRKIQIVLLLILTIGLVNIMGCRPSAPGKRNLHKASAKELEKWKAREQDLLALKSYIVSGKFAYSDGRKGGSGDLRWHQQPSEYTIEITPPLGASSVRIVGQANNVSLMKQTGEMAVAKTPEELLRKTVNWNLPISGLQYWARGVPEPSSEPTNIMFDNKHELAQMEQKGWVIEYLGFMDVNGKSFPEKVTLSQGTVKLKLIFRQWNVSK